MPLAPATARARLKRCRAAMKSSGFDLLALFPGVNMLYMTGFHEEPGERLLLSLIPADGEPIFIVPKLYEQHVAAATSAKDIRAWNDGEDPRIPLRRALEALGARDGTIGLDSRLWARFFLMFLDAAPEARYADAAAVMDQLRITKDPGEIRTMTRGFRATDQVMGAAIETLSPGRTEREIARVITEEFLRRGADQPSFDPIVGSGPNGALPHHRASMRRLRAGDAVVLDLGGFFGGYCTDITRTIFLGRPPRGGQRVYELVAEANERACRRAAPGVEAQDVDRAARQIIGDAGYGPYFTHRTGHGIGMEVHEEPYIVEGNRRPLEVAMTFSVEPGIYLPSKFGVRIEDIVVLGARGARRLDAYPRDLVVV